MHKKITQLNRDNRAITLHALGYNVLITEPSHKTFIKWSRWTHTRQTKRELEQMLNSYPQYENVAILTGFNNHIVIDCDSQTEWLNLLGIYPQVVGTLVIKSNRGYHAHFQTVDPLPEGQLYHDAGFEIWTYGKFSQFAGSKHKSGNLYAIHLDNEIMQIENVGVLGIQPRRKEKGQHARSSLFTRPIVQSSSICDQIKQSISIEDIVGPCDFVKSGKYHMLGYCPFHNDTHRSLSLHLVSNKVKCFKPDCIAGREWNSVIDLWMIKHNCDFSTALENLR